MKRFARFVFCVLAACMSHATFAQAPEAPEAPLPKSSKASVNVSGSIRNDSGTPLCALVLANGQFMFSCSPVGSFSLDIPLDSAGQYTLFGFAEGHFPYKGVFSAGGRHDITLTPATKQSGEPLLPKNLTKASVHISGRIRNDSLAPLCALVLANGQFAFSCSGDGSYALDVPLDANGQYTLFVFAEGHFPYKDVFNAGGQRDVTVNIVRPASNLSINVFALRNATAGSFYSEQAALGDGGQRPYYYQLDSLANGAPPLGMSIDLNGFLTGTPSSTYTTTRTFNFGVCVVDIVATIKCKPTAITVIGAQQMSTMSWTMKDQCNNGQRIWYRFFDRANDMQWPENRANAYFMNYSESFRSNLTCVAGAKVCYGAEKDDHSAYWGDGIDGTAGCADCCQFCDGGDYSRTLTCGSPPSTSYYANWSCGSSGQCATVMGGSAGSEGPFCALSDCQRWGQAFIPTGYSCSTTATYTPRPGGSSCHTYP